MTATPPRDPMRTFVGGAMMAIGGLVAVLCGLCTATFMVAAMVPGGDKGFFVMALVIGGIPTAIGVGLFVAGRAILRAPTPPPSDPPPS